MFSRNVGQVDRILRIIIGAALIAGFFLMPDASYCWLFLIGVIPLATGLMSSCLLYRIFGISTNR